MTKGFTVKIKKIASALMAFVMVAGVLSGCGGTSAPEEVVLSVWCAGEDIPADLKF